MSAAPASCRTNGAAKARAPLCQGRGRADRAARAASAAMARAPSLQAAWLQGSAVGTERQATSRLAAPAQALFTPPAAVQAMRTGAAHPASAMTATAARSQAAASHLGKRRGSGEPGTPLHATD